MSRSSRLPIPLKAKTAEELYKKFAQIQSIEGAQLKVLAIYFDGKSHIMWYYPASGTGFMVMG